MINQFELYKLDWLCYYFMRLFLGRLLVYMFVCKNFNMYNFFVWFSIVFDFLFNSCFSFKVCCMWEKLCVDCVIWNFIKVVSNMFQVYNK